MRPSDTRTSRAATRLAGAGASKITPWALALADDINNQYELGLNDTAAKALAFVIANRAARHYAPIVNELLGDRTDPATRSAGA